MKGDGMLRRHEQDRGGGGKGVLRIRQTRHAVHYDEASRLCWVHTYMISDADTSWT